MDFISEREFLINTVDTPILSAVDERTRLRRELLQLIVKNEKKRRDLCDMELPREKQK